MSRQSNVYYDVAFVYDAHEELTSLVTKNLLKSNDLKCLPENSLDPISVLVRSFILLSSYLSTCLLMSFTIFIKNVVESVSNSLISRFLIK